MLDNEDATSNVPETLNVPSLDNESEPTLVVPLPTLSVPPLNASFAPDASSPANENEPLVKPTDVPLTVVQVPPLEEPPPVGSSAPLWT